jgi:hypothetical protein
MMGRGKPPNVLRPKGVQKEEEEEELCALPAGKYNDKLLPFKIYMYTKLLVRIRKPG